MAAALFTLLSDQAWRVPTYSVLPVLSTLCAFYKFSFYSRQFTKMPSTKQAALLHRRGGKRKQRERLAAIRRAACTPRSPDEHQQQSLNSADQQQLQSPLFGSDSTAAASQPVSASISVAPNVPALNPNVPSSASTSKLARFATPDNEIVANPNASLPTGIVDLNCLQPLFDGYRCTNCRDGYFRLSCSEVNQGFVLRLFLVCSACDFIKPSVNTSARLPDSSFKTNRAAVLASLAGGFGLAGLKKFSEFTNMPVISETSFLQHSEKIYLNVDAYKNETLNRSVYEVRKAYKESVCPELGDNDILDITVSYDGSWHTRGHSSNNGLGCVIDIKTGLVIDYHIMTKYCKLCETVGEEERKKGECEYDVWMREHKSDCMRNFDKTPGAMEVEAALVCWGRSESRGLRYMNVVSDGDCKTIKKINELKPYGDVEVVKEECINHVAKRLGKALRDLVDTKKKQKITLGGRGEGKLTQVKINKLQKYYTKAIRSSAGTTLEDMQEAVMATFHHCTSTDEEPKHSSCPEGLDSWCFYQRARARGDTPPSHKEKLTCYLAPSVAAHVLDVYKRLSSSDLLSRCLSGQSQNRNECLHSLIWSRCPKHIFVNKKRLETSIAVAIGEFNEGSVASRRFSKIQGFQVGTFMTKIGEKRDSRRKYHAEYGVAETSKARRRIRVEAKRKEQLELIDKEREREGGLLYEAGGDD